MRRVLTCMVLTWLLSLGVASTGAKAQTSRDDPATVQHGAYQAPLTGPPAAGLGSIPGPPALPPGIGVQAQPEPAFDSAAQASPFNGSYPFATAQCRDAWFSFSQTRESTCAGHGGVLLWILEPGSACNVLGSRIQQGTGHPDPRCSVPPPVTQATPTS